MEFALSIWEKNKMKRHILLLFLFASIPIGIFGQSKKYIQIFHEYYDNKPIHFGFQFGFSSGKYFVSSANTTNPILSPSDFGFFVGGTVNYALNKYFEAKSGINVALYDRRFKVVTSDPNEPNYRFRESTWLEIPILMKFRSLRRKNHRAFLVGGVKVGFESNKKDLNSSAGELDGGNMTDLTIEYGFGFEKFNKYFKLSPEIRFSNGLLNMYSAENNLVYAPVIQTNTITLILNFE